MLKLIVILAVVASIHEFGHFIFAKLFKMKVNEFAIGFGKAIWSKEYKGTKFSIRCLPLGGYCAIEGEDGESNNEDAFCNKAWWKRIIVLVAGVTFNAILAIIIFVSINMPGSTYTNVITDIEENSVAYEIGLRNGDRIKKINNTKINILQDIASFKDISEKETTITYERDGNEYTVKTDKLIQKIGYIGVYFDAKAEVITSKIDMIEGGSSAQKAGLRSGDVIKRIDGKETNLSKDVINIVYQNPGREMEIIYERDGKEYTKTITPGEKEVFSIGTFSTEKVKTTIYYASCKAYANIKQIVGSYADLFKGKVSVNQLSGIIGMGEVVSKTDGVLEFLNLIGIISMAVGVANIMPFPPLDGGKVVLVLTEAVTRKKVSPKLEAILSYVGLALLLGLTLYVTYNDIVRIF